MIAYLVVVVVVAVVVLSWEARENLAPARQGRQQVSKPKGICGINANQLNYFLPRTALSVCV